MRSLDSALLSSSSFQASLYSWQFTQWRQCVIIPPLTRSTARHSRVTTERMKRKPKHCYHRLSPNPHSNAMWCMSSSSHYSASTAASNVEAEMHH